MIANCAKMGVYNKSEGGDHPTATQKETLEWTLLWLLFDTKLFRMTDNKSVTIKTREEDVKVTNPTVLDNTGGVQSALWKSVLKGHNQFANKRCPCFRVERTLSDSGPGSLMSKLRIKLKNALESGEFSLGPDFGQASMVRYFSKRAKGKGWKPSPWSTSTGQFGGRDLASN